MKYIEAPELSFKDYLFKDRQNKIILLASAIAVAIQFIAFKYVYPNASFIHGDSFSYINAAAQNLDINTYMVGYSKFLRLFSVFTKSDTTLVAFQYLLIQGSILFLLFTVFYFYKTGKLIKMTLLCFMIFNPLFLHLANLVSSDCLFTSLSLVWFTLLLWIIHQPSSRIIFYHAIVVFIAFTVRYNALIYPFISAFAFGLSRLPLRSKLIGIASGSLLCVLFIFQTTYKYKELTGIWQYSPFSGWQFANNAMYAYRYIDSADRKPVPAKFKPLDKMIQKYFDSTRDTKKHPIEEIQASTFYMWSRGLPLMKYRDSLFKKDTAASELKKWASMGPLYKDYGIHIIKQYPLYFIRYFIWPNANKYYAPPVEFLEDYNSGKRDVTETAKTWFGYKSRIIGTRSKSNKVWVLDFYPILSGIINVMMLFTIVCYIILKGWRNNDLFRKGVLMAAVIWLLNAGFTIFASSAALRFQSFPILLITIFCCLMIDWLRVMAKTGQASINVKGIPLNATDALSSEIMA